MVERIRPALGVAGVEGGQNRLPETTARANPLRSDTHCEFPPPNPYFTKVLTKKYIMKDEENDILEMAEGTEIAWKPNKNVTVKVMKKKSKGKRSSGPQTKIEKVPSPSPRRTFFAGAATEAEEAGGGAGGERLDAELRGAQERLSQLQDYNAVLADRQLQDGPFLPPPEEGAPAS